jgi:hypothetical protein
MNFWPANEIAAGFKRFRFNQSALPRLGISPGASGGKSRNFANGTPGHQRLSVPSHKILRVGTLNGIIRAVAAQKGVDREAVIESLR